MQNQYRIYYISCLFHKQRCFSGFSSRVTKDIVKVDFLQLKSQVNYKMFVLG